MHGRGTHSRLDQGIQIEFPIEVIKLYVCKRTESRHHKWYFAHLRHLPSTIECAKNSQY